jgi:hypothetical protein
MVARVENWQGAELPLKSTPFAAEIPLRPPSPSTRPPEVFEGNVRLSQLDIPPLPTSVSTALAARPSSYPPVPSPAAAPARPPSVAPARSSSRAWLWLLLLLLLVGAAAYFIATR